MKFSLLMPGSMRQPMINHPFEAHLGAADFRRIAATADELGFDAISVPEHLVVPRPMTATMDPYHWHALTGMGFLAGATRRCLVNSSVMVLPLHNPVELAKAVATLDVLTDGRVMCTFGAGYTEGEFAAVGAEFARRGQVCNEYLEAMIELWESPNPAYDGEFVRFRGVVLDPRPRRRSPIWLGGGRLTDLGVTWTFLPQPPLADLEAYLDHLRWQSERIMPACRGDRPR